jgi:hypothetical protein
MGTGNVSTTQLPIIEQFQKTAMDIAVTIMDGTTVIAADIPMVIVMRVMIMVGKNNQ